METSSKQKAAADAPAPSTRRKRARQIGNRLAFVRPHADRYETLPRGEQRKLIEMLSKKSGSSEIPAARLLETNGIREFPSCIRGFASLRPLQPKPTIPRFGRR